MDVKHGPSQWCGNNITSRLNVRSEENANVQKNVTSITTSQLMLLLQGRNTKARDKKIFPVTSAVTICQILFPIDKRYDKSKLSR